MMRSTMSCALAFAGVLAAQAPPSVPVVAAAAPRPIDLAICLDVSGSMEGLLNAARQNLWAVVNELATLQPAPQLRVALLTFGCPGYGAETGFVRVDTGLTSDLDLVSQKLFELSTDGGDEYVARVVRTALDRLEWSPDPAALKLLFVAGNEAATQDPLLAVHAQCREAIGRTIVVNSIYCGDPNDQLAPGWREVAQLADGRFTAIAQDQNLVVATPFDEQLVALSAAINTTYVPYGKDGAAMAGNQVRQDGNAAGLNPAAGAQRCQTKASGLYWNSAWDLVDACSDPQFVLADVDKATLPEALRGLSVEALRAHVDAQRSKRVELQAKAKELGERRDAFVQEELRRRSASGEQVFEQAVLEAVREQASAHGFLRATATEAKDVDSPFVPVLRKAVEGYREFACVTVDPHHAPELCRAPAATAHRSRAAREHGGKLYLLYASTGFGYLRPGEAAPVGETLVKEAWTAEPGTPQGETEAARRYGRPMTMRDGDATWHAGSARGLFVMHKLAPDTPDTDQGWIYGTIDRNGVVTSAGRVASCIRCHEDAAEDRRFGLR